MRPTILRQTAAMSLIALGIGAAALWRSRPAPVVSAPAAATRAQTLPSSAPPPELSPRPPTPSAAPSPVPLAAAPAASEAAPPGEAPVDEQTLMAELRDVDRTDPEHAVELAREATRLFPRSADAPERTSILVHALATLGRISEARGEAEDMVNSEPDSPWVRDVERFTGAHRRPGAHPTADR